MWHPEKKNFYDNRDLKYSYYIVTASSEIPFPKIILKLK